MEQDNELVMFIRDHYGSVDAFSKRIGVNRMTAHRFMKKDEAARRNMLKHLPELMKDTGKSAGELTQIITEI